MTGQRVSNTTTTDLTNGVSDYSLGTQSLVVASKQEETKWINQNWTKWLKRYKTIPQFKQAVDTYANWAIGMGWSTPSLKDELTLRRITGNGKDTLTGLSKNAIRVALINGESYMEIVRDKESGRLINLKPMDPQSTAPIYDSKNILLAVEDMSDTTESKPKRLKPSQVFLLPFDRVANEIHGTGITESCEWVLDALEEALYDRRRLTHRMMIRVIEVDSADTAAYNTLKREYKDAIKNGEVLILPKDVAAFPVVPPMDFPNLDAFIEYLEGYLYQAMGISKAILGGSQAFTEAAAKTGILTFETPHSSLREEMEQQWYNQIGIEIDYDAPVSLKDSMSKSEAANTGQVGIQPNNTQVGVGRQ